MLQSKEWKLFSETLVFWLWHKTDESEPFISTPELFMCRENYLLLWIYRMDFKEKQEEQLQKLSFWFNYGTVSELYIGFKN